MKKMLKPLSMVLLTALSLPAMQSCVSSGELQSAVSSAKQDGIEIGYDNGFEDGKSQGFSEGKSQGFSEGYLKGLQDGATLDIVTAYNNGVKIGDAAGFKRGLDQGYDSGYINGFDDGYDDGYGDGHTVGFNEGYAQGYSKGDADGYNIGYDDGYSDGDAIGYSDGYIAGDANGYNDGWYDGYDVGYDDGWYDAGGFSSKLGSVNAATQLAGSMMDKLIDLKGLKSPKAVLADAKVQGQLSEVVAGITSDSVSQKAILEKYLISSIQEQLGKNYGLNQDRSLAIARLANKLISTTSHRELVAGDTNLMAQEVLGSSLESIQDAVLLSAKGNKVKLDAVIIKAAEVNKITVKQAETIMTKLVL